MIHHLQRNGSRGIEVKTLQDDLKRAGFNPGQTDGVFGPKTEAAVKAFQQAKGLTSDGIVGPKTWKVLDGFDDPKAPVARNDGDIYDTPNTAPIGDVPKSGNAFIDSISTAAVKSQQETGVPASVTMAQAILESGWGCSGLARNAHNYFGIKGDGPAGHVTMRTREVVNGQSVYVDANFRKYNNAAESFVDHGEFLRKNSRYAPCFKTGNPEDFARGLQSAGYATDPHYADALIKIMRQYHLEQYDKVAAN
jgi:hypothetical protein